MVGGKTFIAFHLILNFTTSGLIIKIYFKYFSQHCLGLTHQIIQRVDRAWNIIFIVGIPLSNGIINKLKYIQDKATRVFRILNSYIHKLIEEDSLSNFSDRNPNGTMIANFNSQWL